MAKNINDQISSKDILKWPINMKEEKSTLLQAFKKILIKKTCNVIFKFLKRQKLL